VVILLLFSLVSINTSPYIDHRTQAVFLADSELEKLQLYSLENLSSYTEDLSPDFPGFIKEVAVEDITNGGKKITVTIKYPEGEVKIETERYE